MAEVIPERFLDLFEKKAFANLATLMADGSPQVTPVWVDFDGARFIVNSARGRQKDRNIKRNPSVALAISDPGNPYRYLEVRGRVVEITEDDKTVEYHRAKLMAALKIFDIPGLVRFAMRTGLISAES